MEKKLKRITWGVAYRVHEDKVEEVKSYLDYRFISLINKKETLKLNDFLKKKEKKEVIQLIWLMFLIKMITYLLLKRFFKIYSTQLFSFLLF